MEARHHNELTGFMPTPEILVPVLLSLFYACMIFVGGIWHQVC